mmetsp:Transcript_7237/g.14203  ORF Transcript_7237/g.14203 Transcript_7237/m.14203 type:complete len:95 (+) Transcript_7237:179-463(+)
MGAKRAIAISNVEDHETSMLTRMIPKDYSEHTRAPGVSLGLPATIDLNGGTRNIKQLPYCMHLQDRTQSCIVKLQKKVSGENDIDESTDTLRIC